MIAEKERITSKSDGDCDVDADGETDKVTRNVQPAVKPSTTLVNKGEGKSTDEGAGGLASGTAKENGASKANGTANGNDKSGASKSERKDGEDGGSGEGSGGDAGDEKKSESIEKNKKDNAIAKSGSDSSKQADKKEDEMTADGLAEDEDVTMKERQERQESEKNGAKTSEENTDKAVNEEENDEDPFAGLDEVATMDLYNISNYTFGKKEEKSGCKALGDMSERSISSALRKEYGQRGMRRSVRAVLLVHEHNFAHILLLQRNDGKGEFVLPGGKLRPGENFEEGLLRKLSSKLCPVDSVADAEMDDDPPVLEVGDKCKMIPLNYPDYGAGCDDDVAIYVDLLTKLCVCVFVCFFCGSELDSGEVVCCGLFEKVLSVRTGTRE